LDSGIYKTIPFSIAANLETIDLEITENPVGD
jgi:hypothetical protein